MTSRVVVEQVDGGSLFYYGPIEFRSTSEGSARLSACEQMAHYVFRIDSSKAPEVITVCNIYGGGVPVAKLIDGTPFTSNRGRTGRKDRVSDEDLIDKVAQGLKASKKLKNGVVGDFKSALAQCCLGGYYEQRRDRIAGLAEVPEYWDRLGDSLYSVMTRPEMGEHVVRLAMSDRFLPLVKEKLVNTDAMRREAEIAEAEVTRELNAKKAERDKAQLKVDEVQADLASAQARQAQVRSLMEDMLADRDALAAELLRDSVVRSAMDRVSAGGASAAEFEGANIALKTHATEDELEDPQLAAAIQDVFSERAGRDLSLDEAPALVAPDYSGVPAYSWERLAKAFGPAGKKAIDPIVKDAFKGIVGAMSAFAPVSQRAQGMVRGYVMAASRYIDPEDPTARLGVLDRAVAQKVLPQINLPASAGVEEMLGQLQKECASLPTSHAIVSRIRRSGADNGFYTYFA